MLKNRIIPCLDVKNGRVVKGINFVDLVDAGDPVEQAKIYDEQGADELCFLDITASNENRDIILGTVKKTAEKCFMPLTVGGGVRTLEDIRNLLLAGADKVSINTAAVNNKNLVKESSEKFGSQCIVVAVDAKKVSENKWEIFTHGGRKSTGIDALKFVEKMESLFDYDLSQKLEQIRPSYTFDSTCQGSVPQAIIAFLESTDFEDAIRNSISLGGDADTQACITGSLAEAYYKSIPAEIASFVRWRIEDDLLAVLDQFNSITK